MNQIILFAVELKTDLGTLMTLFIYNFDLQ